MKTRSTRSPRFAPLAFCFAALLAAGSLTGCGLINGLQDRPEESNACGGDGELTWEGEPAELNDPCGPCGRDRLDCDNGDPESDSLTCTPGGTPCEQASNFEATGTVEAVELSWDHVEGATSYRLRRDGETIRETSVDSGTEAGDTLQYTDTGAEPGRPAAPGAPEAVPGDDPGGIELSWEPPSVEPGPEHTYELVAVHQDAEEPESPPVEATARREAGELDDDYEYRYSTEDGEPTEWTEFPGFGPPSDGRLVAVLSPGRRPEAEIDGFSASDGDGGWQVELVVDNLRAEAPPTTFEIRAVTENGVAGDVAEATGRPLVEEFDIEWSRALSDDDADFEPLASRTVAAVDSADQTSYEPDGEIGYTDVPPLAADYDYRITVQLSNYDSPPMTSTDTGFRGKPATFSGAEDGTLRRIRPDGDEAWQHEPGEEWVTSVATDADDTIFAATYTYQSDEPVAETLYAVDAGDKTQQFSYDDLEAPVTDMATCPGDELVAVDRVGTTYRVETDDYSTQKFSPDGDDFYRSGVAMDDECNSYVFSADGVLRHVTFDGGRTVQWQTRILPEDFDNSPDPITYGPVAVDGDGNIHVGTEARTLHVVAPNGDELSSFDLPEEDGSEHGAVTDLAVDGDNRVYATRFDEVFREDPTFVGPRPAFRGYLYAYEYGDFNEDPTELARLYHQSPDDVFNSALITAVEVDPRGRVYFSTRNPSERIYKLPGLDETGSWSDPQWIFDGHATTPNPDPTQPDGNDDSLPQDCLSPDTSCVDVEDIAVTPGPYGAFPDTWNDVQQQLDGDAGN